MAESTVHDHSSAPSGASKVSARSIHIAGRAMQEVSLWLVAMKTLDYIAGGGSAAGWPRHQDQLEPLMMTVYQEQRGCLAWPGRKDSLQEYKDFFKVFFKCCGIFSSADVGKPFGLNQEKYPLEWILCIFDATGFHKVPDFKSEVVFDKTDTLQTLFVQNANLDNGRLACTESHTFKYKNGSAPITQSAYERLYILAKYIYGEPLE